MMSYHDYPHPVSRTYQYKKITKPLLERKRRARINRCLDELKDLMVDALETEGENISKLEKADILELTVRHLQRLQAIRSSGLSSTICATSNNNNNNNNNNEVVAENRWQSGFGHCAAEACRFLSSLPGEAAERLARHLAAGLQTNRQTNSSTRSSLLSPTLASLDRAANSVAPIPSALAKASHDATSTSARQVSPKVSSPYPEVNSESSHSDVESNVHAPSPPIVSTSIAPEVDEESIVMESEKMNSRDRRARGRSNGADDEEEIDVERVDDGDPMWRPW